MWLRMVAAAVASRSQRGDRPCVKFWTLKSAIVKALRDRREEDRANTASSAERNCLCDSLSSEFRTKITRKPRLHLHAWVENCR